MVTILKPDPGKIIKWWSKVVNKVPILRNRVVIQTEYGSWQHGTILVWVKRIDSKGKVILHVALINKKHKFERFGSISRKILSISFPVL